MEREGEEIHTETDAARGGSTPHIVRWILGISLVAVIVLLSAVWIFGAASHEANNPDSSPTAVPSTAMDDQQRDGVLLGDDQIPDTAEPTAEQDDTPLETIEN